MLIMTRKQDLEHSREFPGMFIVLSKNCAGWLVVSEDSYRDGVIDSNRDLELRFLHQSNQKGSPNFMYIESVVMTIVR